MAKLTPEQRRRVAEAVMDDRGWEVNNITEEIDCVPHGIVHWKPNFQGSRAEYQIQAGQIVYFLAEHYTSTGAAPTFETTHYRQWQMMLAIANNDTDALEKMAFEILEASND